MSLTPLVVLALLLLRLGAQKGVRWDAAAPGNHRGASLNAVLSSGDLYRAFALVGGGVLALCAGAGQPAATDANLRWFAAAVALLSVPHVPGLLVARLLPLELGLFLNTFLSPHWVRGHDLVHGVLCVLETRSAPDPDLSSALRRRISHPGRQRPVTLLAHAALLDAEGQDVAARDLMLAIHQLPWGFAPHGVQRRARAWLMARAARRGDHARVRELAAAPPTSWSLRSLRDVLLATMDGRPVGRGALLLQALLFGRHRLAAVLWDGPPPAPPPLAPPAPGVAATVPDEALLEALRWRRHVVLRLPTLEDWRAFAQAWAVLPDREPLLDALDARMAELGVRLPPPEDRSEPDRPGLSLLHALFRDAVELAGSTAALRHALPPPEGLLVHVRAHAEAALRGGLDEALAGLGEPHRLAMLDDPVRAWLAWQRVRNQADALSDGASELSRHQTFQRVLEPALDFGAWCWNRSGETLLGHLVFLWLKGHGERLDATEVNAMLDRNLALRY